MAVAAVVAEESKGEGADVIIVAAPAHAAQQSALELAAIGGRINFFGGLPKDRPTIEFDSNRVHYKELVVTGTTACSTSDCRRAAALDRAARRRADHDLPLAEQGRGDRPARPVRQLSCFCG